MVLRQAQTVFVVNPRRDLCSTLSTDDFFTPRILILNHCIDNGLDLRPQTQPVFAAAFVIAGNQRAQVTPSAKRTAFVIMQAVNKQLAFVLSGGGARGALQVGALRALAEAGVQPDLLVGTSAGAINATMIALYGMNPDSVERLARAWREAATSELLTSNYVWVTLSALFNRSSGGAYHRMRDFFVAHGLASGLRFGDIHGARLYVVTADLNCGCPVVYGADPQQSVLEAVLASAALPPWVPPIEKGRQLLVDGGMVSNLPVEAALAQGATEIIALDLSDPREIPSNARGWLPFIAKLRNMAERRQTELELALAEAQRVPVRRISLQGVAPIEIWDFHHAGELIERGYEIARHEIEHWQPERPSAWPNWLRRVFKSSNINPPKERGQASKLRTEHRM